MQLSIQHLGRLLRGLQLGLSLLNALVIGRVQSTLVGLQTFTAQLQLLGLLLQVSLIG